MASAWRENLQLILTLVGVIVGCVGGGLLRYAEADVKTIGYVNFPGEILMNMLKMMIIPLIAASLISGLSQLEAKESGRISRYAFMYYGMTTTFAVILGIFLVIVIHPGNASVKGLEHSVHSHVSDISGVDKFLDVVRNLFPDNLIEAMFRQTTSEYVLLNATDPHSLALKIHKVDGMNVLGVIVFCVAVGVALSILGEKGKPLADLFISLDHVVNMLVELLMWYAPIGIASLIAAKVMSMGNVWHVLESLSLFVLTVVLGLELHLFGTISLIYFIASRKNPYVFLRGLLQAAMTALGTASSAASLPVTFRCLEVNNNVDPCYTKFVLPIGAMINMDGTALYEAVASIFIAQINGIELEFSQIVTVSLTATLASIGAASIPSAGLVTMLIVLSAVGLPADDISIIITIDWLLDRIRTCVNVCGDGVGCGFVQELCEGTGPALPTVNKKVSDSVGSELGSNCMIDKMSAHPHLHAVDRRFSNPDDDSSTISATDSTLPKKGSQ
uniref:Amino acid transporter n=1 Tax=Panagrellus redivivus TaxID=6233 RepID=A0A7E4VFS3_PANRE